MIPSNIRYLAGLHDIDAMPVVSEGPIPSADAASHLAKDEQVQARYLPAAAHHRTAEKEKNNSKILWANEKFGSKIVAGTYHGLRQWEFARCLADP